MFKQKRAEHDIYFAAAHDSYLINLATADSVLFERSYQSFVNELQRSTLLGLDAVPGYLTTLRRAWQRTQAPGGRPSPPDPPPPPALE